MVRKYRSVDERIDDGTLAELEELNDGILIAERRKLKDLEAKQGLNDAALKRLRAIEGIIAARRLDLQKPLS